MKENNLPKYIDVHAHMNFAAYDEDRAEVISRALENETWMINVGTKFETSASAVALTEQYEAGVYAIVGLHPIHTSASFHDKDEIGEEGKPFNSHGETFDMDAYRALAQHPKVVGIGECGLDFFRPVGDRAEYEARQREAFAAQIELAVEVDKPLMIHCRDAYPEVLEMLREARAKHGARVRGNFHFFAGTEAQASEILELGFTMSFTGVVTFAADYKKLVETVPLEKMFSETDCPYVTPAPHRGKRNEPFYVSEVVKKIAEIKGLPEGEVAGRLVQNAVEFFGLK
jgi:TatD DNase family protein